MMKKAFISLVFILLLDSVAGFFIRFTEMESSTVIFLRGVIVASGVLVALIVCLLIWLYNKNRDKKPELYEQQKLFSQDKELLKKIFRLSIKQIRGKGRNRINTIYDLPWFLMVGSDLGKNSLLRQNGFELVLGRQLEKSEASLICQFWGNGEAIIIEVGDHLYDSDGINERLWEELCNQLKKYRGRQALNGALAFISCEQLLTADKKQRQITAQNIQEAILTTDSSIGLNLPVYTLLSNADAILDFVPFFKRMPMNELEKPYGLAAPFDRKGFDTEWFDDSFFELLTNIADLELQLLSESKKEEEWQSIIGLPYQLYLFSARLKDFLTILFSENRLRESLWFRGFYFFSCAQKGNSYDALTQSTGDRVGFSNSPETKQNESRLSLFAAQLIKQAVLQESHVVGVNLFREIGYRTSRIAFAGLMGAIVFGFIYVLQSNLAIDDSFRTESLAKVAVYRTEIDRLDLDSSEVSEVIPPLYELRTIYQRTLEPEPWYRKIALPDDYTDEAVHKAYFNQIQEILLPKLIKLLSDELNVSIRLGNQSRTFELLRNYQMIFEKQLLNKEEHITFFIDDFNDKGELSVDTLGQLTEILNDLYDGPYDTLTPNFQLIELAQQTLDGFTPERLVYSRLKALPELRSRFDVRQLLGKNFTRVFEFEDDFHGYLMPIMFTQQGHEKLDLSVKSKLLKKLMNELRVVNGSMEPVSLSELASVSQKVQRFYYSEYIFYWKNLLNNIKLKQFKSPLSLAKGVDKLRDPTESPLVELLDAIVVNTQLAVNLQETETDRLSGLGVKAEQLKRAADKVNRLVGEKATELQAAFAVNKAFESYAYLNKVRGQEPTVMAGLLTALSDVNDYIQQAISERDSGKIWFEYAKQHADGAEDPINQLKSVSRQLPNRYQKWMEELSSRLWLQVVSANMNYIETRWNAELLNSYRYSIAGRFPFTRKADQDVILTEFADFFKPNGKIDQFVSNYLAPFVEVSNAGIKPLIIDNLRFPLSDYAIQQLKRASDIQRLFFAASSDQPSLSLRVRPKAMSVDTTRFILDGTDYSFRYQHGPRLWQQIKWPEVDEDNVLSAAFYNRDAILGEKDYNGRWAFFHLLYDGRVTEDRGVSGSLVNFYINKHFIQLQITVDKYKKFFSPDFLLSFKLPPKLSS